MSPKESLISNFKDMSDREILIATCLKVEGIEARMDKHSIENDLREGACLKRFEDLSNNHKKLKDLIDEKERENEQEKSKTSLKKRDYLIMVLVYVVGNLLTGSGDDRISGFFFKILGLK